MKNSHGRAARGERGERGAALITALLMTTLLLSAGGALIVTASMSATTAADSTAEMQAYYAAEAGLESALAVVRRNLPSTTSPALPATFRNIVCGTVNPCANTGGNFSQWLTYTGGAVTVAPGLSYTLTVRDASVTAGGTLPAPPYAPRFLLVTSTGRGPKGARKVLEMTVDAFSFDFTARAAVALHSHDTDTTAMTTFTIGNSNPHTWNGNDLAGQSANLPAFAVTNTADFDAGDGLGKTSVQGKAEGVIRGDANNVIGDSQLKKLTTAELDWWLKDANSARLFLTQLRAKAVAENRLMNPSSSDFGTDTNPKFSFVDGDLDLTGNSDDGAGLLVVTGRYTQSGSADFNGIVLALGEGIVDRNGTPGIEGALVVARFQHVWNSTSLSYTGTGGFTSPSLTTSGGGNSVVGYNSAWVRRAMESLGSRVVGVVEK